MCMRGFGRGADTDLLGFARVVMISSNFAQLLFNVTVRHLSTF